jgi:hypothetical protein
MSHRDVQTHLALLNAVLDGYDIELSVFFKLLPVLRVVSIYCLGEWGTSLDPPFDAPSKGQRLNLTLTLLSKVICKPA